VQFHALQAALVQRRVKAQADHQPHQADAVHDGPGAQLACLQPGLGDPAAGQVDGQAGEQGDRQQQQLERAQQATGRAAACGEVALPTVVCDLPHQRRRHPCIEQLQPGLQHGEKADEPVRLRAQVAQVERQNQDADQQGIGLAEVIQAGVADHR